MNGEPSCPNCGTPLSGSALGGLCRKCLGRLGFGASVEDSGPEPVSSRGTRRFGDYELLEEIARGGMGVVYRARQLSLDRVVAVKMVLHGAFSSEDFVRRFRTEAQAAASLHHPNIVPVYEVGEEDGHHYFSMEYIEGKSLAELVREKPLPAKRAAGYVKTIAEAMHYAHQRGVLHRDLKPSNVLLDIFDQPRVTDFGLAKLLKSDSQLTVTGETMGSPYHMPPEQALGKHSAMGPPSDIYSLGSILYHLLTGRPAFQGETLQDILLQVQHAEPVPPRRLNPSVPIDLQTICLKCLQKEPARRYDSAQALADDLGRFLASEPIHARPVSPAQKLWLWCRRRPVPAALSGALLLAVLLGLAGVVWQWRRAERHALGETGLRQVAVQQANKLRLNLYAADVALAAQAMARGDYGLARRTLAALEPKSGESDLRGFEWRYLWNFCRGDQLATLTGHVWIVTCAAFSPDGRLLVSGSQDGTAKVWSATDHRLIKNLTGATGAVWSVAFSPDGGLLLTASSGAGIKLWNTDSWQLVTSFPGQIAAFSRTAPLLAVSESNPFFWEPAGKVSLWNYRTGERLKELSQPGRALALSPDGRTLAVAGETKDVLLWDIESEKLVGTLPTEGSVWSLSFSPDGRRLVTAGWNREALLWNLERPEAASKLTGHSRTVWSATFSPDGATVVTTSSDQTIRLWDAVTLQVKRVLHGHENEVWWAAFSPDGKLLASGGKDQTVRLWRLEVANHQEQMPHDKGLRPIFSPDGGQIEVLAPNGRPQLWNSDRCTQILEISGPFAQGFSPDGNQLVHFDPAQACLRRWSPKERSAVSLKLADLEPGKAAFARTGFSPGWDVFFAIDETGLVRCWDSATGKLLVTINGPVPPIRCATLGPAGKYLALGLERENIIRLYEMRSSREQQLVGHRDFVSGLAFSPDGVTLASGSMDATIRLWDTATGKQVALLPGHMEEVTDVAFAPDGQTLASLGRTDSLKLWHLPTQREIFSLDFPRAGAFLQFSPDGRHLAVTTEDNSVRLFDAPPLAQ